MLISIIKENQFFCCQRWCFSCTVASFLIPQAVSSMLLQKMSFSFQRSEKKEQQTQKSRDAKQTNKHRQSRLRNTAEKLGFKTKHQQRAEMFKHLHIEKFRWKKYKTEFQKGYICLFFFLYVSCDIGRLWNHFLFF